jgi:Putative addiction module component
MYTKLPLDEMTIEDKIRIMEDLWTGLSKKSDDYPSPDWHQDVLLLRERRVKEGKDTYKDWERAKKELQIAFNED